jgi:methylthioribose-1-phosphate isomerase
MLNSSKLTALRNKLPLTIELSGEFVRLIDQTLLPARLRSITLKTSAAAIKAIRTMQIRGAQAIGACGAAGVYLAARKGERLDIAAKQIIKARPTAVNLAHAVKYMLADLPVGEKKQVTEILRQRLENFLNLAIEKNSKIGEFGAKLIKTGDRIMTHCNAGSLSAVWLGTATAPMYAASLQGKKITILVDETRPWLQGSRLTAWELAKAGLSYQIQIDAACGYILSHGLADMVIVGADRIARNGDTANKIGTYPLALMAKRHKVPFYVAAVTDTIDKDCPNGKAIPIEERDGAEVLTDIVYRGAKVAPAAAKAFNPVFDVTPAELITGIITEQGIFKPKEIKNLV